MHIARRQFVNKFHSSEEHQGVSTYRHCDAAQAHIRAQPFADACTLPKDAEYAAFVPVHWARKDTMCVCRCADDEKEDEE